MPGYAGRMRADIGETAELIAVKHTIFALPFAVISLITAADPSWPAPRVWFWVLVAMVSARTAAMAFNRLADHRIDAENPRTALRALPDGRLSRRFVWTVTAVSAVMFVIAAGMLNRLCLILALPTLAILLGYSYAKRFTPVVHLWLGAALGMAPIGSWVAEAGSLAWPPVILGAAVMFWVAGFDVIYSLQDEDFDRRSGLFSLPAALGGGRSLTVARLFHVTALIGFAVFAAVAGGGWLRFAAVIAAGLLLAWQHRVVSRAGLVAVDAAFFSANGILSVLMCAAFLFAKILPAG